MRSEEHESLAREIDQKGGRHQSDARFYGVYRGTCVDNNDPHVLRRVRVRIPEFYGEDPKLGFRPPGTPTQDLPWALGCVPPGSTQVPSVGDVVWVMFEKGDPYLPVWIGKMAVAPISLRDAVVNLAKAVVEVFTPSQSTGAIQPPTGTSPPVSELDKTKFYANKWDIDARFLWAIRLTENGRPGREFGVLGRRDATDFDGQANLAAETVSRTLDRYKNNTGLDPVGADGRYTDDFMQYFSRGGPGYRGYAPLNAPNDPNNLNSNHLGNLKAKYSGTSFA